MAKAKKFAVFDIDGTLVRWQMFHALYDQLGRTGHLLDGDYETICEARRSWEARKAEESFRAYELRLIEIVDRNIVHIDPKHFEQAAVDTFATYKDRVYRYTRDLIKNLKDEGYFLLAISGSPQEIVTHLVDYYGFDDWAATVHGRKDGRFTNEVMVAALHKPELLQKLVAKNGLNFEGSIGVGDSEGDIAMLEMVEHPVAFNPSKKLFLHAEKNHWKVVVERKNMIYEFEAKDGHYRLTKTSAGA